MSKPEPIKVRWDITRLDGTNTKVSETIDSLPHTGDGAHPDDIPVTVTGHVKTEIAGILSGYDYIIMAKENRQ